MFFFWAQKVDPAGLSPMPLASLAAFWSTLCIRIPTPSAARDRLTACRLLAVILIAAACAGKIGNVPSGNTDDRNVPHPADLAGDTTVYTEAQVDKKAEIRVPLTAAPKYPSILERTGTSGEVQIEFVVDRMGNAEIATVRILKYTHLAFVEAVRQVLPRIQYVPAELRSKKVRQLAKQSFQFRAPVVVSRPPATPRPPGIGRPPGIRRPH